ncbi:MAG: initiation factor 2 [Gemmatimonadetes bacterium]|nr:initiation factor 2 [Gemmatimonadota bacterium]
MPSDLSTVTRQLLARATLNLVIKGDLIGSVLALSDSLDPLSTAEVRVQVIHQGVGAINESDVLLASAGGALVIGFRVGPTREAVRVAESEDVDIRLSNVIDEAVEEVKSAVEKLLAERKPMLGTAEVRDVFRVPRVGEVAGCLVTSGVLDGQSRIRVIRDGRQVYEGEVGSLRRFKEDVREVREGLECSVMITRFQGLKAGDVLECYRL